MSLGGEDKRHTILAAQLEVGVLDIIDLAAGSLSQASSFLLDRTDLPMDYITVHNHIALPFLAEFASSFRSSHTMMIMMMISG